IRDRNVTGVQTCALPIFLRAIVPADQRRGQLARIGLLNAAIVVTIVGMLTDVWAVTLIGAVGVGAALAWHALALLAQILRGRHRSEERRVGKASAAERDG